MGTVFDQNAANTISKELYTEKDIETLCFSSPLVGRAPKFTEGGGLQYVGAINNALSTSNSSQDTIAFTTGSPSILQRWQCPWKQYFASANLSGMAVDQTRKESGAMVTAIKLEMDNGYKAIGSALGRMIYGNGGGSIGQGSTLSTTTGSANTNDTLTLLNTSQAINFQVGQIINSASTNGLTGSVRAGSVTLISVDLDAGILQANVSWAAGITGFAAADYLFNQGDFNNYFPGMAGWFPNGSNRPTSTDSFNGVNRFSDPVRLAGVYYTGSGAPIEESLVAAGVKTRKFGGKPKDAMLNPLDFASCLKGMGGRVQYTTESAFNNAQIGFDAVKVSTGAGQITLYEDAYVASGQAYLLDLDTLVVPSMGPMPKNLSEEMTGLIWIPQTTSNTFIAQMGFRATTYCSAPSNNCSILW
jgi:hypothetical protein